MGTTTTTTRVVISAVDDTGGAVASVKSRLALLGREAANLGQSFVGLGAALTTALAATGVAGVTKQAIDAMGRLDDLADATGASVESLSALENTARRTGASFETVQTSVVKLNQALISSKAGSEQEAVFRALGLSVAELRRLDPAEAFVRVSRALAQFANDGEKARAVQVLFGRSLAEVAPLLKDVAERGLEAGTVTADAAAEADKFGKNLAAVRANTEDLARSLATRLLPALNEFLSRINQGGVEGFFGAANVSALRGALDGMTKAMLDGKREYDDAVAELAKPQDGPLGLVESFTKARAARIVANYEDMGRAAAQYRGQLLALTGSAAGAGRGTVTPELLPLPSIGDTGGGTAAKSGPSALDKYIDKLAAAARATQNLSLAEEARIEIATGALRDVNGPMKQYVLDLAAAVDAAREATREATFGSAAATERMEARERRRNEALAVAAKSSSGRIDEFTRRFNEFTSAALDGDITAQEYSAALEGLGKSAEEAVPKMERLAETANTFADQASRNIQDALGDTLLRAMEGNFSSIGKLWLDLLRRMAAQAMAMQLNRYLFGAGVGTTDQGLIGGFFASIFKRADGGPVSAGTPYLVGELGPEIVVPRQAGTVIPNHQLGATQMTFAPVVHIHGSNNVTAAQVEAALARERMRFARQMRYA